MTRKVVISEDFGLYRVRTDHVEGAGSSLELALASAFEEDKVPSDEALLKAAEVLEPLLGRKWPDSELVVEIP